MFTDSEATPARVELLLDVVRSMSGRKIDRPTIKQLLQPDGLPDLTGKGDQANKILLAARELDLVTELDDGMIRAARARDSRPARIAVVDAIDEKVLSDDRIEPWFALFYAFLLGRDEVAGVGREEAGTWEARFEREVFDGVKQSNRFNGTKYVGLRRWFRYCGLGWHDGDDCFHPNPYERVARRLPLIFAQNRDLAIDSFMLRLSEFCPELDGGFLFLKANRGWDSARRTLTLGLAHALVDLHLDALITLNCPLDTDGWSIAKAQPPRDRDHLKSDRIASVCCNPSSVRRDA